MSERYSEAHIPARKRSFVTASRDGSLALPTELAARYGVGAGEALCIEDLGDGVLLHRPITSLAKIYVEPTNDCPFSCRTCMRSSWHEPVGRMEPDVFSRVLEGLAASPVVPAVFFGGIGEPLSHPGILSMVERVKATGAEAQLITNGLALSEETVERLVDLQLDVLWVSLDGATRECYEDVRQAPALPSILESLRFLRAEKYRCDVRKPELGIAFVAMVRNRSELPEVLEVGARLGASRFSISNLQPHAAEMRDETAYGKTLGQSPGMFAHLDIARMDSAEGWDRVVAEAIADSGLRFHDGRAATRLDGACPFLESGSVSIRWDGAVSPCLPLLHSHYEYLGNRRRTISEFSFGSLSARSLLDIWQDPSYVGFRGRLQRFDFAPCLRCNGCDLADGNREDCVGSNAPSCGACAWAHGFIVCP
jgi:MoaA/NifB/PqqE/SkfB family radical SAM enzyme